MAHFNFIIPNNKEQLLNEDHNSSNYRVSVIYEPKEIYQQLEVSCECLKDEGVDFILTNFDIYYSIYYQSNKITDNNILIKALEHLQKACDLLNKNIEYLLNDKSCLNFEIKTKTVNIIKMLIFLYIKIIEIILEKSKNVKEDNELIVLKTKGKTKEKKVKQIDYLLIDKEKIILTLNNIFSQNLNLFWDPPVIEDDTIILTVCLCLNIMENLDLRHEKGLLPDIFGFFGNILKNYNLYANTFINQIVVTVRNNQHFANILPEGVEILVRTYNCKGIIHSLVKELTECQINQKYKDTKGDRHCSMVITEMAKLMPDFMLVELNFLENYLSNESVPLRSSVLNVMSEVILNTLTKNQLNDNELKIRDELFDNLIDHTRDRSVVIRSKVFQHFNNLEKNQAIPIKYHNLILEKCIKHLRDTGVFVRKMACSCLTTYLSYNIFGPYLELESIEKDIEIKLEYKKKFNIKAEEIKKGFKEDIDKKWSEIMVDVKNIVIEEVKKKNNNKKNENEKYLPINECTIMVRMYLEEKKYKEAFWIINNNIEIYKDIWEEFTNIKYNNNNNNNDDNDNINFYIDLMRRFYINIDELANKLKDKMLCYKEFGDIEEIENAIEYLNEKKKFVLLMEDGLLKMNDLLESISISDVSEAVDFIIAAKQFKIKNSNNSIMNVLKLIENNDENRKKLAINALIEIYLKTNSNTVEEHAEIVVKRLINLIKTIPLRYIQCLEEIISNWAEKDILDNAIIDCLWKCFTKRIKLSSDDDSRACCELLRITSIKRSTILIKNFDLIANISFEKANDNNMLFLSSCWNFLILKGEMEKVIIDSDKPPFKYKIDHPIFKKLIQIINDLFFNENIKFFNKTLKIAIDLIYSLSSKPQDIIELILKTILKHLEKSKNWEGFIICRSITLFGYIACKETVYLDDTVYKELQRRNYIREKFNKQKQKENKLKSIKNKRQSALSLSNDSSLGGNGGGEEQQEEEEEAKDYNAEFIINVLNNEIVTGTGVLAQLYPVIKKICVSQDYYNNCEIIASAVTALCRYMLVSSQLCKANTQLLFTILEKSSLIDVKCNILIHMYDLLTRFPNIIDPWTPLIYNQLKNPNDCIRKSTFFTLSNLILKDMIRAHSHLSKMAYCIIDSSEEIRSMAKTFFISLGNKQDNLYNVIPDVFSHFLVENEVTEENLRLTMKFFFEISTHSNSLVDRFCLKFTTTEDLNQQRNIAYCLGLINYNDKSLRRLLHNFSTYKFLLQDKEIYKTFKGILNGCIKKQATQNNIKALVTELEENFNSVFEINQNQQNFNKTLSKRSKNKPKKCIRKKIKKTNSSSDSDD